MVPIDKLEQIKQRFEFLEAKMNDGAAGEDIAKLAKEYSELRPVVEQIGEYQTLLSDLEEAQLMLDDPDMKDLAAEELPTIKARIPEVEHALQLALLPKDAADARPAMLEIRPGTGGEEAALFAGDLLRMYQRYCETRGWTFDVIEEQQSEIGGIKEVVVHIKGEGVFARMKYESGVHRVQRVPETESGGACIPLLRRLRFCQRQRMWTFTLMQTICGLIHASSVQGAAREYHGSAVRITHLPQGWL